MAIIKTASNMNSATDFIADTSKGTININKTVLISVIKDAVLQVPGIIRLTSTGKFSDTMAYMIGRSKSKPDSVSINFAGNELTVCIKVIASFGVNINELGLKVQMSIAHLLKQITQLETDKIDVFIENVENRESDNQCFKYIEPII